jgi:Mechanosensitive ion channel, conserved TM helix
MQLSNLFEAMQGTLGATLPGVVGALAILVGGWLAALIVRAGIRKMLGLVDLNQRVRSSTSQAVDIEGGIAAGVYYVILLLVLIGFFNALKLERVASSLQSLVDQVFSYAPKLAAGAALAVAAWILATAARAIATRALGSTTLDDKLRAEAGMRPASESLGDVLYWLVILLFLPAVLGALGMTGLLTPVEGMVNGILAMVPNILGAGVVGVVGWFVARILRDLVTNLLSAAGADKLGERAGLRGTTNLSRLVGLVVYIFVFVPALIAALNALAIDAISKPATEMLGRFLAAVPDVVGAALILAVAYLLADFVADLAKSLLGGMGFDRLPAKLGLAQAFPAGTSPSALAGRIIVFFVMLFGTVEAANRLGFGRVSELVSVMIEFGAQVLLGVAIIAVGFWLSNLAAEAIRRVSGPDAAAIAGVARFGILGIVIAMGLRAMGLADDIVNLAFGLTLGSIAVAVALSFGLGGREAAGRQMEHWLRRLRGESGPPRSV